MEKSTGAVSDDHQPGDPQAAPLTLVNTILLTINQIQLDLAIVFHHP
jgi:hypothetical protein